MLLSTRNFRTNLMIRKPLGQSRTGDKVQTEEGTPNRAALGLVKEVISRAPAEFRKARRQLSGE
jgi:hypothetical protein